MGVTYAAARACKMRQKITMAPMTSMAGSTQIALAINSRGIRRLLTSYVDASGFEWQNESPTMGSEVIRKSGQKNWLTLRVPPALHVPLRSVLAKMGKIV